MNANTTSVQKLPKSSLKNPAVVLESDLSKSRQKKRLRVVVVSSDSDSDSEYFPSVTLGKRTAGKRTHDSDFDHSDAESQCSQSTSKVIVISSDSEEVCYVSSSNLGIHAYEFDKLQAQRSQFRPKLKKPRVSGN